MRCPVSTQQRLMIKMIIDRCLFFAARCVTLFHEACSETWIAQCLETRQINSCINLYLLDAIPAEAVTSVLPSERTRINLHFTQGVHLPDPAGL